MKNLFWHLKTVINRLIYVIVGLLPKKDIMNIIHGTKVGNKTMRVQQKHINRQSLESAIWAKRIKLEKSVFRKYMFMKTDNAENRIFHQKRTSVYGSKRIRSGRAPCRNRDFPFLYINVVCFT